MSGSSASAPLLEGNNPTNVPVATWVRLLEDKNLLIDELRASLTEARDDGRHAACEVWDLKVSICQCQRQILTLLDDHELDPRRDVGHVIQTLHENIRQELRCLEEEARLPLASGSRSRSRSPRRAT